MILATLVTVVVVASMLRQPALRRIGLRNFGRRKWNTALVILGSMVGTALISGSLVLNDSTTRFQENEARETLGEIDEVVQKTAQRLPSDRRPVPFFDESAISRITSGAVREESRDAEAGPVGVDGALGAVIAEVPAEALNEKGKPTIPSPAVTVIGADWGDLEEFGAAPPPESEHPAPKPGEAYISESLAKALELEEGRKLRMRGVAGPEEFEVAAVLPETGISGYKARFSSSEGTMLVAPAAVRGLIGAKEGKVNTLFVSNEGDVVSGSEASGRVKDAVLVLLKGEGSFEVAQVKKDTIEQGGLPIGQVFLMISSFAILAGILLIVNIYTMLAEERKAELGILRAVALKRGGLVRVFVYEGYVYSLLASIVGAVVGLGIAAGLVYGINRAATVFADLFNDELRIPFHVEPDSVVAALCAGLLITFLAVFLTSLRISNLNIVAAIRDLPEEETRKRRLARGLLARLVFIAGIMVAITGFSVEEGFSMLIGPVLMACGLGFLLGRLVPSRPLWSVVSASVLAYAYFANELEPVAKANEGSPAMFFVEGVFMVLAAVLLVTFNLGLLYGALRLVMRLVPRLAPVLKMAVAHPASRRARTGFTLAMFALILYIVTVSSVFNATQSASSESAREGQLSGYDGFLQAGPITPLKDFDKKVEDNDTLRGAVTGSAKLSAVGVTLPKYKAEDYKTPFGPPVGDLPPGAGLSEYLTYAPDGFLRSTTDELAARSPEYATDREAWRALSEDPDLVMLTFPYDGEGDFQARPKLGPGDEVRLLDPISGKEMTKTVVGRIESPSGFSLGVINGIIVSEAARKELPNLPSQDTYLMLVNPKSDEVAVGRELKNEFAATGAQSFLVDDILGRGQAFIDTFVKIVQAFLAFGLVVGVAGLAVISARAVHERRREIGTLRAVGYRRGTVGWQFIVESSFVALIGILIGISVGALGGYNLFNFAIDDPEAVFVFPWRQMFYIGGGVWVAALAFTIVPAIRASRVPPVEALRYEG
ncbi:MAG: FtsX-like permease family protein [Rubrobacteraceae bacterium]